MRVSALKYHFCPTQLSFAGAMQALEESFKYAGKRFDAGLINSVDYNTNKNNLRRAESELAKAKYEYIFKRKILDFFQGKEITL